MNKIKFLRAGVLTTTQDGGRAHLQHLGISKGGAAVPSLMKIANLLVGNELDNGLLEFCYQGPKIKIEDGNCLVSIVGNIDFTISKKNKILKGIPFQSYYLEKNDEIDVVRSINSIYGYIAFNGTIKVPKIFSSISANPRSKIGPNNGKKIENFEVIEIHSKNNLTTEYEIKIKPLNVFDGTIRVLEGPQFDYFSDSGKKIFFDQEYQVTNATDKMGMRLKGDPIDNQVSSNIKSEGIVKGGIQVPADGQPIVLLTDHQTIGGYPKIAVVASVDFEKIVQMQPKSKVRFKKINLKEAFSSFEVEKKKLENIFNSLNKI